MSQQHATSFFLFCDLLTLYNTAVGDGGKMHRQLQAHVLRQLSEQLIDEQPAILHVVVVGRVQRACVVVVMEKERHSHCTAIHTGNAADPLFAGNILRCGRCRGIGGGAGRESRCRSC